MLECKANEKLSTNSLCRRYSILQIANTTQVNERVREPHDIQIKKLKFSELVI